MSKLFNLTCIIHILIWVFVMFAFVNKKTAYYNIYYVIPFIYLIHMLPFHILNEAKKAMDPENWETGVDNVNNALYLPELFTILSKYLDKKCFINPLSPQGMLILGLLTSGYMHTAVYNKCNTLSLD